MLTSTIVSRVLGLVRIAASLAIMLAGGFSGWASAGSTEVKPASGSYPPVYYRDLEFKGRHCVPAGDSADVRELYLVDWNVNKTFGEALREAPRVTFHVAEFFSGRRYRTKAVDFDERNYRLSLMVQGKRIDLDCVPHRFLSDSGGQLIDASGDYLKLEEVSTDGRWGGFYQHHRCDAGIRGWFDCDVGIRGVSRRSADGKVRWAKLIAVAVPQEGGSPLYKLPRALRIEDSFDTLTPLDDGTAVLTFRGVLSVRLDIKEGALLAPRPDVAVAPLDDWAALKHVLYRRWNDRATRPCDYTDRECEQKLIELYHYTLQDYLFPLNRQIQPLSGDHNGKSE